MTNWRFVAQKWTYKQIECRWFWDGFWLGCLIVCESCFKSIHIVQIKWIVILIEIKIAIVFNARIEVWVAYVEGCWCVTIGGGRWNFPHSDFLPRNEIEIVSEVLKCYRHTIARTISVFAHPAYHRAKRAPSTMLCIIARPHQIDQRTTNDSFTPDSMQRFR